VGNDICHIPRIARIMGDSPGKAAKFVRRVLTEEEISHPGLRRCISDGQSDGKPTGVSDPDAWKKDSRAAAVFMAGRWAAKEAIIKAYPFRRLTFHDIMIYSSTLNLDFLKKKEKQKRTAPRAIQNTASATGDPSEPETTSQPETVSQTTTKANSAEPDEYVSISISHDGDYASAVCI
ncbi:hypothetical protein V8F33_011469, partial [Rhypophila sp. PSN 637]